MEADVLEDWIVAAVQGPVSEIQALISLIEERKTGWAVDIAKERIKRLEQFINNY